VLLPMEGGVPQLCHQGERKSHSVSHDGDADAALVAESSQSSVWPKIRRGRQQYR
jgi:hypothetical protein